MLKLNESLVGYMTVCNPLATRNIDYFFKEFCWLEKPPGSSSPGGSRIPVALVGSRVAGVCQPALRRCAMTPSMSCCRRSRRTKWPPGSSWRS